MDNTARVLFVLALAIPAGWWLRRAGRAGKIPDDGAWQEAADSFRLTFSRRRAVILAVSVGLMTWAAVDGLTIPAITSTDAIALCWLAGAALGLGALAGPEARRDCRAAIRQSWRDHRGEWGFVLAVTGLALLLRTVLLGRFPVFLTVDEENFWGMVQDVYYPGRVSPFATGWAQHPFMIAVFQGYAMRLLGEGVLALRLPSALLGTLHVPALYLLARTLYGRRVARWSALALALLVTHVMHSRFGLNQVGDTLTTLLALVCLLRAWRGGRPLDYVLFGALLGMGQFFYAAGLFSLVMVVAFVGVAAVRRPDLVFRQADGFVLSMAAFALLTLPYYAYLLAHGLPLLPRSDIYLLDRIGIQAYLDILAVSPPEFFRVMALSLRDVYLAYAAVLDTGRYAFAALPLAGLVGVPLFVVGGLLTLRRWRLLRYWLPLSYLLLIPLPTLLAVPIPDYFRYVLAMPFTALLVGLGGVTLVDGLGLADRWNGRLARRWVVILLVMAVMAVEVGAYAAAWYTPWPTLARYDGIYREIAAQMTANPPETHYYLIFQLDFFPFWSTVLRTALGRRIGQAQYVEWAGDVPPRYYCDTPYTFFVGPGRASEVDILLARFPDMTARVFRDETGAFRYARLDRIYHCP